MPRVALAIPRVALAIPVAIAEILARTAVRCATRKFLVAAEFSLGPIAIAWRPRTIGSISSRPVTVLAKAFAARRVGSLLAISVPWRIGLLVAEFLVGEPRGRSGIVAIAARRTVGKRPIAAR